MNAPPPGQCSCPPAEYFHLRLPTGTTPNLLQCSMPPRLLRSLSPPPASVYGSDYAIQNTEPACRAWPQSTAEDSRSHSTTPFPATLQLPPRALVWPVAKGRAFSHSSRREAKRTAATSASFQSLPRA